MNFSRLQKMPLGKKKKKVGVGAIRIYLEHIY